MGFIYFIRQYFTKPRTVGAVVPSSRFLARKMMQPIQFEQASCLVEFGPGTGVFTQQLLRRRKPGTVLLLIERNADFCALLHKKFEGVPDMHIINGCAEDIGMYLKQYGFSHAEYIVSGLPFASLPLAVSERILTQAAQYLQPQGRFITFQYTLLRKKFIAKFFGNIQTTREMRNFPPAYVLSCAKTISDSDF